MVRHGGEQGAALTFSETTAGRWALPALAATPAYLGACLLSVGGLLTAKEWGDVGQYERYARLVIEGRIPYADFYVEYPPGAFLAWIVPALLTEDEFLRAFKLEMAVLGICGLFVMAWILDRVRADRRRRVVALGAASISPLLLGHTFLNRFDAWPALLVVFALATLLAGRCAWTGGFLALGFAVKLYAIAVVPVAFVRGARVGGLRAAAVASCVALAVGVASFGLFLAMGFGGVGNTYYTQATRHLQIETLAASGFLVADELGLYDASGAALSPGSIDLAGRGPDVAATATSLLQVALVALVGFLYWRGPDDDERLVAAFAASVAAFATFGKVLSPQFLVWLVFLVPLVGGRQGQVATGLLLAALGATQLELQGYVGLSIESWAVWILLVRNVLLVLLFVVLARFLLQTSAASAVASAGTHRARDEELW